MKTIRSLNKVIINLLSAGMKKEPSPETREKLLLAFLFNSLAILAMLIFLVEAMSKGNYTHGFFLLSMIALVFGNFIFTHFTDNEHSFYNVTVWLMAAMCIYLLNTGGVDNTGTLWCYVFPLLSLYLQGLKKGIISLVFIMGYSCIVFFIPNYPFAFVDYSTAFKTRFIASMITVSSLSYLYQYSRENAYSRLLSLSLDLEKSSFTDYLTGLANRRKILQLLEHEQKRYARYANTFSIILSDIDHFKNINDTYGHDCGDLVLKSIADILTKILRPVDVVSRWGGEEFLIFLPDTDQQGVSIAAERLRLAVEQMKIKNDNNIIRVTMSFGIATWKNTDNNMDAFIKQADEKLYRAKEEGRNRVIAR